MPLGDVITLQRGFDLPSQNRKPGKVPIVSSSGISDYHSEVGVKGPGVVTGRYPPDLQEEAVKTVLQQAELLCADWMGDA
jgi:hypothetical protein